MSRRGVCRYWSRGEWGIPENKSAHDFAVFSALSAREIYLNAF